MRPTRFLLLASCVLPASCGLDVEIRPDATNIIEAFQGPSFTQAAEWALDPYDADHRRRGTLMLASAPFGGGQPYIDLYVDYLDDDEANVRSAAAQGLGAHGRPEHASLISPLLRDPEPPVRLAAARALQRLHAPEVVDALIASLDAENETSYEVRAEAAEALGQYAERRVVRALIAGVDDEDTAVRSRSRASLRVLTGQDFGLDARAWRDWNDVVLDPFAARSVYLFPVYARADHWYEFMPFVPRSANEIAGPPVGLPIPGRDR